MMNSENDVVHYSSGIMEWPRQNYDPRMFLQVITYETKEDVVRLFFDFLQIITLLMVFLRIMHKKNCAGISGKTQVLYAIAFSIPRLPFPTIKDAALLTICYSIVVAFILFRNTYNSEHDSFGIARMVIPCLLLALHINYDTELSIVLLAFSRFLEAIAIVPQIQLIIKTKRILPGMMDFMRFMFACRVATYCMTKKHNNFDTAAYAIECMFYLDFFVMRVMASLRKCKKTPANVQESNLSSVESNNPSKPSNDKAKELDQSNYNQLSSIVLSPEFLVINDDKARLLPDEKDVPVVFSVQHILTTK